MNRFINPSGHADGGAAHHVIVGFGCRDYSTSMKIGFE